MSREKCLMTLAEVDETFCSASRTRPYGIARGGYVREDKKTVHGAPVESSWPREPVDTLGLVKEAIDTINEVLLEENPTQGSVWGTYLNWTAQNNHNPDMGVILGAGVTSCLFKAIMKRPELLPAIASATSVAMVEGLSEVVLQSVSALETMAMEFKKSGSIEQAVELGKIRIKEKFDGWDAFASHPQVVKGSYYEVHCLGRKTAKILFDHVIKLTSKLQVLEGRYVGGYFDKKHIGILINKLSKCAVEAGAEGEELRYLVRSKIQEEIICFEKEFEGNPNTPGVLQQIIGINRHTLQLEEKLANLKSFILGLASFGSDDEFDYLMGKLHRVESY